MCIDSFILPQKVSPTPYSVASVIWQQISEFFFSSAALSNSKGEFLLNGDFVVTMSKREIRIGNTMIEYSGSDNVVERINCTDRIEQELLLQVTTWP